MNDFTCSNRCLTGANMVIVVLFGHGVKHGDKTHEKGAEFLLGMGE